MFMYGAAASSVHKVAVLTSSNDAMLGNRGHYEEERQGSHSNYVAAC